MRFDTELSPHPFKEDESYHRQHSNRAGDIHDQYYLSYGDDGSGKAQRQREIYQSCPYKRKQIGRVRISGQPGPSSMKKSRWDSVNGRPNLIADSSMRWPTV